MTAPLIEHPQRLEFDAVHTGDQLVITTGTEAVWRYDFTVDKSGHWPQGTLTATAPSGEVIPPDAFALHGCGRWTTRRENPVQTQERGFTPYYDGLIVGSLLWAKHLASDQRVVFGRQKDNSYYNKYPGDEISTIAHTPYRQNTILNVLLNNGALSVSAINEALTDSPIEIPPKDVRSTLMGMVKSGRVSLLRKKVMLFEVPAGS